MLEFRNTPSARAAVCCGRQVSPPVVEIMSGGVRAKSPQLFFIHLSVPFDVSNARDFAFSCLRLQLRRSGQIKASRLLSTQSCAVAVEPAYFSLRICLVYLVN